MLVDLVLKEVYDSAEHDIVDELQVPLLCSANSYLRGVGYFSSGWMKLAARGLHGLVRNGGKARIVVSPILDEKDWNAFQKGDAAKRNEVLYRSLSISIDDIAEHLEHDTLNTISWMVADGLLEFRLAVDRLRGKGDYHDKVAVFADQAGSTVAIHGSFNDSVKASLNGEAFSVFRSWIVGQEPFVAQHKRRLEDLWANQNNQFETLRIPDAIRERIVRLRQTESAPYSTGDKLHHWVTNTIPDQVLPIDLRPYQTTAIEQWREAGFHGILEMATGTGKTVTALSAALLSVRERNTRLVVISVPYLHLMEQWAEEARDFGFRPIFCSGSHPDWTKQLKSCIIDASLPGPFPSCVIVVHQTAASARFVANASKFPLERTLLIADEVHGLGASHLRQALFNDVGLRLGLSATPSRWFDDEGTDYLKTYFGGVCYDLPLEAVIGTFLTPYRYYPQLIHLNSEEQTIYGVISKQIATILAKPGGKSDPRLKSLLLKRTRLIASAQSKLPKLIELIQQIHENTEQELRDILVYSPAGQHKEYLNALSKIGLRCHEFVHSVTVKKREEILKQFASGEIQVLIAVKCLDEGVDVPSTRIAFILSSSTNPREFVQRRGRILRKFHGKNHADVYDFLVVPHEGEKYSRGEGGKGLLRREMPRLAEFASSALNQFEARSILRPIVDSYEMLPLLDKRPWEVYKELKEAEWEMDDE